MVRTYFGLHFKLVVTGTAERFSWARLGQEIVLKFGLLGVITAALDLLWQIGTSQISLPTDNLFFSEFCNFGD